MPFPPALAIANALAYAPPFITKNIERPVRAFRVQVDGIPAVSPTAAPSHAAESTLLSDKPSIAVLPFRTCRGSSRCSSSRQQLIHLQGPRYRGIFRRQRNVSSIWTVRSRVGCHPSSRLDFVISPTSRGESPGRRGPTLCGTGLPAMRPVSATAWRTL